MKIMMNMTDCREDTDRFRDSGDVERYVTRLGFDGLELLHCPGEILLFFHPGWLPGCICVTGMTGWICGREIWRL